LLYAFFEVHREEIEKKQAADIIVEIANGVNALVKVELPIDVVVVLTDADTIARRYDSLAIVRKGIDTLDVLRANKERVSAVVDLVLRIFAPSRDFRKITDHLISSSVIVSELGEAEAGAGFAFAREELLHQAAFVGLQRFHFPALRGNHLVQRRQAVGDFLLFRRVLRSEGM
jgi:hypothetical protein